MIVQNFQIQKEEKYDFFQGKFVTGFAIYTIHLKLTN